MYLVRTFTLLSCLLMLITQPLAAEETFYDRIRVTTVDGEESDLNRYQGGLVLINFWATWCPPCIKEMPSMNNLQQQFKSDEFQIVAINMGQSATTVDSFLMEQTFEFDLPVYLDETGRSFTDLKIQGMPSSFLVGPDGKLIETIIGAREWDHPGNIKALRELISETKKGA